MTRQQLILQHMDRERTETFREGDLLDRRHRLIPDNDNPVGQMRRFNLFKLRVIPVVAKVGTDTSSPGAMSPPRSLARSAWHDG